MPLPSHRHTHSKALRRRSHHALKKININLCTNCQAPIVPHRVCKGCGFYRGASAVDVSRGAKRAEASLTKKKAE